MSWPQWPIPTQQPSVVAGTAPILNPAPTVMPPGMPYTTDQYTQLQQQNWQQWAQWQQQYQQWHQQYGAEYQKSMSALAAQAAVPNLGVPPPLPTDPQPPLPQDDITPKPPLPGVGVPNASQKPPMPNYSTQPPPVNNFSAPPPGFVPQNNDWRQSDNELKRPIGNADESPNKRQMVNRQQQSGWRNQNVNNPPPPAPQTAPPKTQNLEELSEAEKKFDKQFAEWEAQFNKWKDQNSGHPDKQQYREYEKKWEQWRQQLLDRREAMRRKRLGLMVQSKPPSTAATAQNFNVPPPNQVTPPAQPKGTAPPAQKPPLLPTPTPPKDSPIFPKPPPDMNDEPLDFKKDDTQQPPSQEVQHEDEERIGFLSGSKSDGIPGLDLVAEGEEGNGDEDKVEEVNKGPDLEAISKGINNILGDEKLLSMLSMVSQNQSVNLNANNANTVSKVNEPLTSQEQSNLSGEDSRHETSLLRRSESVQNFDDQTRSSFTMQQPNEEFYRGGPPNNQFNRGFQDGEAPPFNRQYNNNDRFSRPPPGRFEGDFDNTNRGGGQLPQMNRPPNIFDRPPPLIGPNNQGGLKEGPNRSNFGAGNSFGGPGSEKFGGPAINRDKFGGPPPNGDNFGPNRERFGGPEPNREIARGPGMIRDNNNGGPCMNRGSSLGMGPNKEAFGGPGINRELNGGPNMNRGLSAAPGMNRGFERPNLNREGLGGSGTNRESSGAPFMNRPPAGGPGANRNLGKPGFNREPFDGPGVNNNDFGAPSYGGPGGPRGSQMGRDKFGNVGRGGGNGTGYDNDEGFGRNDIDDEYGDYEENAPVCDNNNFSGPPSRFIQGLSGRGPSSNMRRDDFSQMPPRIGGGRGFNNEPDRGNFDDFSKMPPRIGGERGFNHDQGRGNFGPRDRFDQSFQGGFQGRDDEYRDDDYGEEDCDYPPPPSLYDQGGGGGRGPQPFNRTDSLQGNSNLDAPEPPHLSKLSYEDEHSNQCSQAERQGEMPDEVEDLSDEGMWKPTKVIDYDHKPLKKPPEQEILVQPFRMFDYRHRGLRRIPFPERPNWLSDAVRMIPEFDPPVIRPPPVYHDRFDHLPPQLMSRRDNFSRSERFERERNFNVKFSPPSPEQSRGRRYDEPDWQRDRSRISRSPPPRFDERERVGGGRDRERDRSRDERGMRDYDRDKVEWNKKADDWEIDEDEEDRVRAGGSRDTRSGTKDSRGRSRDSSSDPKRESRGGARDLWDVPNDNNRGRNLRDREWEERGRKWEENDDDMDLEDSNRSREKYRNEDDTFEREKFSNRKPLFPVSKPSEIATEKGNGTLIEDLINAPGRFSRPPRIVIILRGPPGSGKTHLAKLIKDKEVENGGSPPRILSLDDYFIVEQEKEVIEDGKKIKVKDMVYEFEAEMEESYRVSLMRSFKKTITDGYFPFIIVDNVNDKVKYFGEMWSFAKQNGFQVYVCQLDLDVQNCTRRNVHDRTEDEISKCVRGWERTPSHHPQLDVASLLQEDTIPDVEMEEIDSPGSAGNDDEEGLEDRHDRSKWDNFDCSINNLARLDGVHKPLRASRTMEEYLQLDDNWTAEPTKTGQKRVRWADLEERKELEKMRAIGFVVGLTDWDRMMDPTQGERALTQTKFIEGVQRRRF